MDRRLQGGDHSAGSGQKLPAFDGWRLENEHGVVLVASIDDWGR